MTATLTPSEIKEIRKQARLELARKDFWTFCKLLDPEFYKDNRKYLKRLCSKLQQFAESNKEILIINMPPRHGKSHTVSLFADWLFGKNKNERIMTASYNERLAINFARFVRDTINTNKSDPNIIVYSDIFPQTRIKQGEAAANLWALEGAYSSYLATSPTGTATGFGASYIIIDDLIKSSYEAHNAQTLENHWSWFTNTMLSRLEANGKLIIIATRWCNDDLTGRLSREYPQAEIITEQALNQETGEMLCEEILSREKYERELKLSFDKNITIANYQQITIDAVNKTYYKPFGTYELTQEFQKWLANKWEIYTYCDTADEGDDWLCGITYTLDYEQRKVYILDIYYTQEPMEKTEIELTNRLIDNRVYQAIIESNNGGKGFARSVKRNLQDRNHYTTQITWFTQTKNKLARINTNAPFCMDFILFPKNWELIYPEFYRDLNRIQITGAMLHDDCADALTGVAENAQRLMH